MKVLRDWREEVIESIQDAIGGYTSNTSEEDELAAISVYDRLLEEDYLNLPDVIPDPPKPAFHAGGIVPRSGISTYVGGA